MPTDSIDASDSPSDASSLAARFQRFGERECKTSPLYEFLSLSIARDPEILAIAAETQPGQPKPNMLYASVHYLLLKGVHHPLANFYADLTPEPIQPEDSYDAFREFCLRYRTEIVPLLKTRYVQTNEVKRCMHLVPAFQIVAERAQKPLYLVEVGSSAGLNLLWNRYYYNYDGHVRVGSPESSLHLDIPVRGEVIPPVKPTFPAVADRIGLDLNPLDPTNADDVRWLQALIWPEHKDRAERLRLALEIAQDDPPRLLAGDALENLPQVLADCPAEAVICVFHSFTLNQFSGPMREQLHTILHEAGQAVYRVGLEWEPEYGESVLRLSIYDGASLESTLLAHCQPHGRWIEWTATR